MTEAIGAILKGMNFDRKGDMKRLLLIIGFALLLSGCNVHSGHVVVGDSNYWHVPVWRPNPNLRYFRHPGEYSYHRQNNIKRHRH